METNRDLSLVEVLDVFECRQARLSMNSVWWTVRSAGIVKACFLGLVSVSRALLTDLVVFAWCAKGCRRTAAPSTRVKRVRQGRRALWRW